MEAQPTFNRWLVVVGAILIQLALGAIYAWSVFTALLTDPAGPYAFSASDTAWVFSAGLATFAIVMVMAGRWLPKIGPRSLAVSGGLLLGTGYVLGGLFGSGFWAQLIFIGLIGGAGIGLGYVVPIAVGVKWFPDKKGLITGLAVAGFGFGATIWVKLAGSWFGGLLNTVSLFGLPGVQSVFIIYGIAFAILVLLGSSVMINPPKGYQPAGWTPPDVNSHQSHGAVDISASDMLQTRQFYMLWSVFMFCALAGLMVIYCIKLFGIDALQHRGIADAGVITGTAMAWYAIFNGIGRIAWGSISDHIGRKAAIILMSTLQGVIMLMIYHVFIAFGLINGFIVAAALIGFNFGGNFALFPAVTADYFGNRNVGSNYGWVFTSYGIAGIAGPLLAGYFKDAAQGETYPIIWMTPFVIAGTACLVGAIIMALSTRPEPPEGWRRRSSDRR
ncbi:MAG: MFS transporter [gamma proteobacterium symbiont of Ctena orbiculata]|nr:MAG: MFS transporter [gamma proteobacterium symbiont of Ctena orbiculata]PVV26088.1 MAG: MFS transporter [gamma proteobacterium symbiont of Ctena orbiculata]